MRHPLALIPAILLAASLAGCGTPGQLAIDAGAQIGTQLVTIECARLKSAALASACTNAAGEIVPIANAVAQGLLAKQ